MGRYVGNISEIILDAVDLEQLISGYVPLKRAGANVKGLCPFHNEKSPSFVVSKEKQVYHCFGCGAAGNAIGFVMAIENLDFLDAIEYLADKAHLDLEQYLEQSNKKTTYKPEDKSLKVKYQEISKHAARFFYSNLKKSDVAKEYFKNRGITDETIKTFGLGYAQDEWRSLIDYLAKPPYTAEELEKAGLIIAKDKSKGHYDRFRDRVMFPIIDVQGKVIAFGGRILGDGQPKYLNSPETPIFNKSSTLYNLNLAKNVLNTEKTLIVVEGYMDVIALYQAGIKNVVATLGTALTTQHSRLLKRYADEIIIAYDSDDAGQKATKRSVEILEQSNLNVRVLLLTDGLDPDEYLKQYGVETLSKKLKKALSYTDYQISLLRAAYNLDYEDDQRRFYDACVKLIKPLPDSALKDKYVSNISKWSHMSEEAMKRDVYSSTSNQGGQTPQKRQNTKKRSKFLMIETRLLYLALLSKESFDKIFELIDFKQVQDSRIRKMLIFLKGYYHVMDKFILETCIDHLGIDEIKYIQMVLERSIAPDDAEKEIEMNCKNFKGEVLSQIIIKLMNQIMLIKDSDELSDQERDIRLKSLNVKLADLKNQQVQLMKSLGR